MTLNEQTHNTVHSVDVVSTGWVRIRPEHAESRRTPQLWWLLTSRRWTAKLPINVYVIDHAEGLVLFDTGQDRRSVTDPEYFPRGLAGWGFRRLAQFGIGAGDTLTAQLRRIGRRPEDVRVAVLSHLHQDHIGGISELAQARLVVSRDEWASLDRPHPELSGLLVRHLRLPGLAWDPVDLDQPLEDVQPFTVGHDLFGDGSLVLLPTPGHTPGSLSMLIRRADRPPLLLVGDLTYDASGLADERIPGVGRRGDLVAATRLIGTLRARHPDLVVLAAHDPAARSLLEASNA
ncbi:MAG: N-acyl homoserine lactonase family protein [Pseudolysinimonas sp.]